MRWRAFIFPALLLFQPALAQTLRGKPPASSELLRNSGGSNDAFSAVGQFRAALTCTGALIDPSGLGAPASKAWLLSAGHCISLEPYGVIRNQPLAGRVDFK